LGQGTGPGTAEISLGTRPKRPGCGYGGDFPHVATSPSSGARCYCGLREHNGDLFAGRQLRKYLLAAGFAKAEAKASVWSAGAIEETSLHAVRFKAQLVGLARIGLAEGWIDQDSIDAMGSAFDAWANRPDAFSAVMYREAIGWVTD